MYKEASKHKLRFATTKGSLSVEQLWDLSINDLDNLAVSLQESYEKSKGKSFLEKRTTKDKGLKLQFDIVLDILQTKVEESELAKQKLEDKAHNERIYELIANKEQRELEGKSVKELKALLRE